MSDQQIAPGHAPAGRPRLYWGVVWRAMAWSLAAGTVAGTVYTVVLSLVLLTTQASLVFAFALAGAEYGAMAGLVAGFTNGVGISIATAVRPPHIVGVTRYVLIVRRVAALCTLAPGVVSFFFLGPISLTAPGILLFVVPTILAVPIAYRLSPRAVLWQFAQRAVTSGQLHS